jgi:hypothetical protein
MSLSSTSEHSADAASGDAKERRSFRLPLLDGGFGLAGERKAIALLCLAFYMAFYGLLSLLLYNAPPDEPQLRAWWACFAALGGVYGTAFFALGADWFWARWFAVGLGYSGVYVAGWGMVQLRAIEPVLLFYGATHGAIALMLQGQRLIRHYEGRKDWRERLGLDEHGVERVRNTVTRAAAGLPTLILIALAPREGNQGLLLLAGLGLCGVLLLRTWGVLLLWGVVAALPLAIWHTHVGTLAAPHALLTSGNLHQLAVISFGFLLAAALPYTRPMLSFLAKRR